MKYKAYPEYKDSGVEWLGEIPESWSAKKISYVALLQSGDAIVSEQIKSTGEYPVYGGNGLRGYTDKYNHEGHYILIGRQGALCGNINYGHDKFWASEHAVVVHPLVQLNTFFFGETLRAMNLNQYNVSAAQPGLAVANITCLKVPFPAIEEQKQIAKFLDHETSKIDTLIEKQQQLIKLLKEKRQAVISHAVTKGLNPTNSSGTNLNNGSAVSPKGEGMDSPNNAPMKDSGVEWLGDVPAHWEVKPLKYVCALIDGDRSSAYPNESDLVDKGIPFVSSKNIVGYKLTKKKLNYITNEKFERLGRGKLADGDLVITVRGTIGHVGIFDPKIIGCETGFINAQMMIMRPLCGLTEYLQWVSESSAWQSQLDVASYGSTVKQLSNQILGNVLIALPPIKDVAAFVNTIRTKSEGFELLITRAQSAIGLMKERRTALISAAVTGKIDVSNRGKN